MVPEPFTKIRIKCPPPVPTTVTFSAERTTQHGQRELILNFLSALGAEGLCKEETCRTWEKAAVPSGFPGGASGKESACQFSRCRRCGFDPWNGKIPWRRKWQPPAVFLPGKSHGQRSLAGFSALGQTWPSDWTTAVPSCWMQHGQRDGQRAFPWLQPLSQGFPVFRVLAQDAHGSRPGECKKGRKNQHLQLLACGMLTQPKDIPLPDPKWLALDFLLENWEIWLLPCQREGTCLTSQEALSAACLGCLRNSCQYW